jgi:hypothetical protein
MGGSKNLSIKKEKKEKKTLFSSFFMVKNSF